MFSNELEAQIKQALKSAAKEIGQEAVLKALLKPKSIYKEPQLVCSHNTPLHGQCSLIGLRRH